MTYAGLVQARNRFHFRLIRETAPDHKEESRKASMEKLLNRGATVVVANGWEYSNLIQEYAAKNPQVKFLGHDMLLEKRSNVVSIVYGSHEGSFLAGAMAGLISKTGKIGFIGGEDCPSYPLFLKGLKREQAMSAVI